MAFATGSYTHLTKSAHEVNSDGREMTSMKQFKVLKQYLPYKTTQLQHGKKIHCQMGIGTPFSAANRDWYVIGGA